MSPRREFLRSVQSLGRQVTLAPVIVSSTDNAGGGDRAAWRLHQSLVEAGLDSRMLVARKTIGDWRVQGPQTLAGKILARARPFLGRPIVALQRSANPILHSAQLLPSFLSSGLNASQADVVNLHWVGGEMMSIRDIGRLAKPVVMTLHDSWAFCGSEHHPAGLGDRRYVEGYTRESRPPSHHGLDIDRFVYRTKRRFWCRPFLVVTPSRWLGSCVAASALMRHWPVKVIPNPIPLETYRPWPRLLAREAYGIDPQARVILFGAIGGATAAKGWDLLEPALRALAVDRERLQAVIVGQPEPRDPPRLGIPLRFISRLMDDVSMAVLLSAADVVVVPSRLENLPQMATEAQACGVPVVGFDTAGVPEVLLNGITGVLARPFDSADLTRAILEVIDSPERWQEMSLRARQYAVERWSYETVSRQYTSAFEQAIDEQWVARS